MSFVQHEDVFHTARRKPHRCWFCDQRINIGERYGRRVGADGGDFWVMKFHPECAQKARDERWDDDDYMFHEPSEFERPIKYEQDH